MHQPELLAQLAQFTGSETFTHYSFARSMLMTEGVVFLADEAKSHWLTDAIASYLNDVRACAEEFQVWRLAVDAETHHAILPMMDGNSSRPIITQVIEYTDFPLSEITIWLVLDGDHRVLMLPSEY